MMLNVCVNIMMAPTLDFMERWDFTIKGILELIALENLPKLTYEIRVCGYPRYSGGEELKYKNLKIYPLKETISSLLKESDDRNLYDPSKLVDNYIVELVKEHYPEIFYI
jgi:hypothetical protein